MSPRETDVWGMARGGNGVLCRSEKKAQKRTTQQVLIKGVADMIGRQECGSYQQHVEPAISACKVEEETKNVATTFRSSPGNSIGCCFRNFSTLHLNPPPPPSLSGKLHRATGNNGSDDGYEIFIVCRLARSAVGSCLCIIYIAFSVMQVK